MVTHRRGFQAGPRGGASRRLSPAQLRTVEAALVKGADAHGFGGQLWTLPRVAQVIELVTGVKFRSGHVCKILGSINWTVRKPTQQAKERNEERLSIGRTCAGRS